MKDRWKNGNERRPPFFPPPAIEKAEASRWWRLAEIKIVDSGNEARKVVLQDLFEIRGCRFTFKNGRRPIKISALIFYSSPELLDKWTTIIIGPEHQVMLAKLFS